LLHLFAGITHAQRVKRAVTHLHRLKSRETLTAVIRNIESRISTGRQFAVVFPRLVSITWKLQAFFSGNQARPRRIGCRKALLHVILAWAGAVSMTT
jgi:hypothetical protein